MIKIYNDLIYIQNVVFDCSSNKIRIPYGYKDYPVNFREDLVYYDNKKFKYNHTDFPSNEKISNPVILAGPLDKCYSHVIYDNIFPLFVTMQESNHHFFNDDKKEYEILFLEKDDNKLNDETKNYKLSFCNIFPKLISTNVRISKYLENNLFLEHLIIYPENDKWQRSIWNNNTVYIERNIPISEVRYSDEYLMTHLGKYRDLIMSNYIKSKQDDKHFDKLNLILIDRPDVNREFDKRVLDYYLFYISKLQEEYQDKLQFNGVKFLENMSLEEQIDLFNSNNGFIFIHGSAEANLLFTPKHSHIFELDFVSKNGGKPRKPIFGKLCTLTKSNHYYLPIYKYRVLINMLEFVIKNM